MLFLNWRVCNIVASSRLLLNFPVECMVLFFLAYCINKQNQPEVVCLRVLQLHLYGGTWTANHVVWAYFWLNWVVVCSKLYSCAKCSNFHYYCTYQWFAPGSGMQATQWEFDIFVVFKCQLPHSWVPIEIPTLGQALSTFQDGDWVNFFP